MKTKYLAIFLMMPLSACTFNVGTGANNPTNTTASNTTNSASPSVENKTVNTATAPKKVETEASKKSDSSANSKSERVQFAKGETSAMLTRDIPANGSIDFVVNVKKGQMLEYTVGYDFKDSDVNAAIYEPDTKDVTLSSGPKERQEFEVKMNGDHRLVVENTTNKKITITLYLDIN